MIKTQNFCKRFLLGKKLHFKVHTVLNKRAFLLSVSEKLLRLPVPVLQTPSQ